MAQIVKVKLLGVDAVAAEYRDIAKNQLPFANAAALTRTARDAQESIRKALPVRFTIRQRSWMERNVKETKADKHDSPPFAVVEDTFDAMGLQEAGGQKLPRVGQYLAVPLEGARPTPRKLIADGDRPHEVMGSGLGFIRPNANGVPIMYRAFFKRGRTRGVRGVKGMGSATWSREIMPMYALVRRADVKPRYEFDVTVEKAVQSRFRQNFDDAFAKAVKTATR
jgi:hypothetical protein